MNIKKRDFYKQRPGGKTLGLCFIVWKEIDTVLFGVPALMGKHGMMK